MAFIQCLYYEPSTSSPGRCRRPGQTSVRRGRFPGQHSIFSEVEHVLEIEVFPLVGVFSCLRSKDRHSQAHPVCSVMTLGDLNPTIAVDLLMKIVGHFMRGATYLKGVPWKYSKHFYDRTD